MPALPALRKMAIEAIGAALTQQDIQDLVMQATGEDVYNAYGSPNDPRAVLISRTLAQLETEGTQRWLLTLILIAVTKEDVRQMIVRTWPETVKLPPVEDQVKNAVEYLGQVLSLPMEAGLRSDLKPKHDAFDEIRRHIAELYAYKSLHEYLHVLQFKIVAAGLAQSTTGDGTDFNSMLAQCDAIAAQAPAVVPTLGSKDIENGWIGQLTTLATTLKGAVAASDTAKCLEARDSILALTRIHLARLNTQVFQAAKELSFDALIRDYPLNIVTMDAFTTLVHAVRELKPTVIARALKQSMWQEADKEISLISNLLSISSTGFSEFSAHWFALKQRVEQSLAFLDPDDPWVKQAQQCADGLTDALAREKLDDDIKHRFDDYRKILRFRFLAIDNSLQQDCSSLRKIDPPLTKILEQLAP